ncbi:MAG: Uma2 family endonuclease [Candidatus Tectomicrobia bacterium]|uniref:Uma2 family endonuclease n=1 Tax=Tectimicrobiota bacterium TaxID=2528274 RepID=A0A937W0Y8_UNCTE|nr:Uma2 family endonuclease [Candidatus Tectomicrobia bacterium]
MATASHATHTTMPLPLLEAGDHVDQATFHACYTAMPATFRAELIGGVVVVPSPLAWSHGRHHARVMTWLDTYTIATPGTQTADNATTILSATSEPQPDAALLIEPTCGGQTSLSAEGYVIGAPELVVEIASSSVAIDLHAKRQDYAQAGVREYVVVVLRQRVVRWCVWQAGVYHEIAPDADGICRSRVFPGLWLHVEALLQLDGTQVLDVLRQGLATPGHVAFVQRLQRP